LSALGRRHGISGARGYMIVKEFLLNNGVDLSKFENPLLKNNKVRRACLKMPGI